LENRFQFYAEEFKTLKSFLPATRLHSNFAYENLISRFFNGYNFKYLTFFDSYNHIIPKANPIFHFFIQSFIFQENEDRS
jgi:hypothetical protein